ncbi:hypothetical protein SAMN04490240_4095 [Rhodococcus pyridinivorans]|uniref:hypothetical protein n=1 Tax=Rhodococcus pyridinivorans TaxID=103816 RepID=UPI0008985FE0|nr:hypothetical protein [Rhodococcus pyridinivorans]SED52029.1 hypothetical protein SAMN04490240_4095 [Rhodococcus pyridinivorans]
MPRIRTVKPEFFRSPSTAKASFPARILFEAMWCWADDFGIGETNLYGLLGFAFCDEDQITVSELQSLLSEVHYAYDVTFYEVDGRQFFAIPTWDNHQKTQRRAGRRNPNPDHPNARPDLRFQGSKEKRGTSESTQGSSERTQGNSFPGTGEQGNRGTGEQKRASASPSASKSPEQIATTNAYERVGKALNYVAVLKIAKWAIHDRGESSETVEDAIVALYEMGKPITKQLLGQYLDGHLPRPGLRPLEGGMSRADQKVQGWLDMGARLTSQNEPKGIA